MLCANHFNQYGECMYVFYNVCVCVYRCINYFESVCRLQQDQSGMPFSPDASQLQVIPYGVEIPNRVFVGGCPYNVRLITLAVNTVVLIVSN